MGSKVTRTRSMEWIPKPYMERGVVFLLENPMGGLIWDPGLSKTATTLQAFTILQNEKAVRRALVIAPVRVCNDVWPEEAGKWADFDHLNVHVLHEKGKTIEALQDESVDIFCINPEGLPWLFSKPVWKQFLALGIEMLIVDESSKFKNGNSKRFKLLKPKLSHFDRRVILTGTPTPRSMEDLFSQVYLLDMGLSLGKYITHYRRKWFHPTGYGGYTWALNDGAQEEIEDAVRPYLMRLEAEDYIDMPELVVVNRFVTLPANARKVYDDMEDDLMSLVGDGGYEISSPTAAAARTKCAQIANGAVYKSMDGFEPRPAKVKREWVEVHDAKLDNLTDLIDELAGAPCLVLYQYKHDLERIRGVLGKTTPCLSTTTPAKSKIMIKQWNNNELSIMLGQPQSISHGLNLQGGNAQHIIWFSLPDDYDVYDQTNRRLRRQGNTSDRIFAYRIMAKSTVDLAKAALLKGKGKRQKNFLDAIKEYRK